MKLNLFAAVSLCLACAIVPVSAQPPQTTLVVASSRELEKAIDNKDLTAAKGQIDAGARLLPARWSLYVYGAVLDQNLEMLALVLPARDGPVDSSTAIELSESMDWAAGRGNVAIIKLLLGAGAQAKGPGFNGYAPLNRAAKYGEIDAIRMLKSAGADVNAEGTLGTPLFDAVLEKRTDAVKALLELGGDPNKGYGEISPLLAATRRADIGIMRILLASGADPNGNPVAVERPLHVAAAWGRMDMIRVLLEAHVVTDVKNTVGLTPADLAMKNKHAEAFTLISSGSVDERPERKARRSEIEAAKARDFSNADLNYGCDEVLINLPGDRESNPNDVSLERERMRDVRAAAEKYSSCVDAYSKKTIPTPKTLVPVYSLLYPAEKALVDRSYNNASKSVQFSIKHGFEFIETRLKVGAEDIARAKEAAERKAWAAADAAESKRAQAAAAAETRRWVAGVKESFGAVQRQLQPATPQIDRNEFAARIAAGQEAKSGGSGRSSVPASKQSQACFNDREKKIICADPKPSSPDQGKAVSR